MEFKKGNTANPLGNWKHTPRSNSAGAMLRIALRKAKKRQGKSFIDHFVDLAYTDPTCAVALAKKILPDLTEDKGTQDIVRTILIRNLREVVQVSPPEIPIQREAIQFKVGNG